MKYTILGVVLVLVVAGGAVYTVNTQSVTVPGDNDKVATFPLVVELVAAVQNIASTKGTGNPTIGTSKMVSVTLTLHFASEAAMKKAGGEVRQLRRAYGSSIGTYLSNREKTATDDIDASISALVAKATQELFGTGVVTAFDVEGQFRE